MAIFNSYVCLPEGSGFVLKLKKPAKNGELFSRIQPAFEHQFPSVNGNGVTQFLANQKSYQGGCISYHETLCLSAHN
jgi:hypothetical protein